MAEEITLKLKVDSQGTEAELDNTDGQLKKIKNSTDDTTESLSLANTQVGKMWVSFKNGAKTGIASMKTLKGAIAATGIGLLLIAVQSVILYFKKTEEGANKLKVIMAVLGQTLNVITDIFVALGEKIVNAFENPKEAVVGLWESIKTNLVNRVKGVSDLFESLFKSLKAGFTGVSKSLQAVFTFGDKKDQLKKEAAEAFDVMKEEVINVGKAIVLTTTGVEDFLGKVADSVKVIVEEIKTTTAAAADLQKRENQLAIDKRNNLVTEAKLNVELAAAKVKVDDATLNEIERLAELNKAIDTQNKISSEQIRIKREEFEIQKELNTLASSTAEDKEKEAQLEAELIQLEAERFDKLKEFETKKSVIVQKAITDSANELKREKDVLDEIAKFEDEAALRKITNEEARRLAKINLEQQYFQEDLQRRLGNEEITQDELLELQKLGLEKFEAQRQASADASKIKQLSDEEALRKGLVAIAFAAATSAANILIGIQKNRLNTEKQRELSNKNLTESQKDKINKKYAKEQQKLDVKRAIINGALAVGNALATVQPLVPAGVIAAAAAAVATGVQVATIKSQKYQTGGIVKGASHANGGVQINAEGGEGMVNGRAMSNPLIAQEVLRLNNLGNAGVANSVNNGIDENIIVNGIIRGLSHIPVVVTENNITQTQKDVAVREQRFQQL